MVKYAHQHPEYLARSRFTQATFIFIQLKKSNVNCVSILINEIDIENEVAEMVRIMAQNSDNIFLYDTFIGLCQSMNRYHFHTQNESRGAKVEKDQNLSESKTKRCNIV